MKFWKLAFLLLLTGCQMALDLSMPEKGDSAPSLAPNVEQRKIAYVGGIFDIPNGEVYAAYPFWHFSMPNVNVGLFICNSTSQYRLSRSQAYWRDEASFSGWPNEAQHQIEKALSQQGYRILQHRQSYFDDKYRHKGTELLLSMRVMDMKLNLCEIHSAFGLSSLGRAGGNGTVTIEWEIYDSIRDKVLGSFITQGYGQVDEPLSNGAQAIFLDAVQNAANHLGKTIWFQKMMTTMDPVDLIPKTNYQKLTLKTESRRHNLPIQKHLSMVRKAVITVKADGDKQGSGFFMTKEGYALTTAGVIGESDRVQIMDSGGTKYTAKVIRIDRRSDVALIKADIHDNSALPIAMIKEYQPLQEVYAIGTPYSNSYRATIVKGMISAERYRVNQGYRLIQADIPTARGFSGGPLTDENGNVMGLAKTISDEADETNFSLFIPIKEALKALNLEIKNEEF